MTLRKRSMRRIAGTVIVLVLGVLVIGYVVSTNNAEVRLRNAIAAKRRDNRSEYDSFWKKIDVTIITSTRTGKTFERGIDDNVDLPIEKK